MKKSIPALLFYSIPWAYLVLYGDAVYGWGWQYPLILACMAAAVLFWIRKGTVLLAGNMLSCCVSLLLVYLIGFSGMDGMDVYFKPFGAFGWTAVLTLFSGLVQWLVWKREWPVLGLLTAVMGGFFGTVYWLQFNM